MQILVLILSMFATLQSSAAESKSEAAKIMAHEFTKSIDMYFVDCKEVPRKLEELSKQPKDCQYWGPDPYIKNIPKDPWNRAWNYKRIDAKNYELLSLGADAKEGGTGENADVLLKGSAPDLSPSKK